MRATPWILVATPLHASHEEYQSSDAKEAAQVINLFENLHLRHASRVGSRRWEVENGGKDKANSSPDTADETDVSPA